MRAGAWLVVCVAAACGSACGRIGFDPHGGGDGDDDSMNPILGDGGLTPSDVGTVIDDSGMPAIACVDRNLGSMLGANVASGTTTNQGNNDSACSGDGNDITFGWFAPATGMYRIDTCGGEQSLDTVLYVRNGGCTGQQLACDDDSCGGAAGLLSRVTVSLQANQPIVIVVDELFPTGGGNYQLSITQL